MVDVPFPQANDFEKIVRIMEVGNEENLSDISFMSAYLDGITDRQVSYYLSAAMYLGLVDKAKHYTELGCSIRNQNSYSRIVEYIRLLFTDPIIGKTYISQKVLGVTYGVEDIEDVIKDYYPDYGEPIYKRRAQTVLSWIKWIDKYFGQNK